MGLVIYLQLLGDEFTGPQWGNAWFCEDLRPNTRALICAPIKPSSGLLPEEAAALAYEAAIGGATIVKDDELAFSTRRSTSAERCRQVATAVRRAEQEIGERKLYIANAIGSSADLIRRSSSLVKAGADALLVAPALQGQDVVQHLRANGIDCPIVVHNAFCTNASRLSTFGVSLGVWALLQRSVGADGLVVPSAFGSFGFSASETADVIESCVRTFSNYRSVLAMHSGSVTVRNAEKLISLKSDTITALTSGTGIFDHPAGPRAGAAALRAVTDSGWAHGNSPPMIEEWIRQAVESSTEWEALD